MTSSSLDDLACEVVLALLVAPRGGCVSLVPGDPPTCCDEVLVDVRDDGNFEVQSWRALPATEWEEHRFDGSPSVWALTATTAAGLVAETVAAFGWTVEPRVIVHATESEWLVDLKRREPWRL